MAWERGYTIFRRQYSWQFGISIVLNMSHYWVSATIYFLITVGKGRLHLEPAVPARGEATATSISAPTAKELAQNIYFKLNLDFFLIIFGAYLCPICRPCKIILYFVLYHSLYSYMHTHDFIVAQLFSIRTVTIAVSIFKTVESLSDWWSRVVQY